MKKGFTLVELLVVIALIAGISIVAVTSLIGIADKRKEESWDNVKLTVENAAKTYHKNNGYLFENLQDGYAWVTVGKLVNEGYLNDVKDPRTGKELNKCSRVLIKIVDGHATYKYSDYTNGECDYAATLDSIEIRTINGPQASYKFYNGSNKEVSRTDSGWFNKENLGNDGNLTLCIIPKIPEGKNLDSFIEYVQIGEKRIKVNDEGNIDNKFCASFSDQKQSATSLYLEDKDGGYWQKSTSFGVDTVAPTITNVKLERFPNLQYNSNVAKGYFNIYDETSGIGNVTSNYANDSGVKSWYKDGAERWEINGYGAHLSNSLDGSGVHLLIINATDLAGNSNSNSAPASNGYTVYKQCSEKSENIEYGRYGSCSKTCGTGSQTRTNTKVVSDKYTGHVCSRTYPTESRACNTFDCCSSVKKVDSDAKIYRWLSLENNAINDSSCDMNFLINKEDAKNANKKQTKEDKYPHSPVLHIKMSSDDMYNCNCYNGQYCPAPKGKSDVGSSLDIHDDDAAMVVYQKSAAGEAACKDHGSNKVNGLYGIRADNIRFVCEQIPNSNGIIADHGWNFITGNQTDSTKKYVPMGNNVWLHNGNHKTDYVTNGDKNLACQKACKYN